MSISDFHHFRKRLMNGRDIHEAHRVSSPLELLFDLTFVVAIAAAASQLHHATQAGHLAHGLLSFAVAMFAIIWAWVGFTWFASAYDTDDASYRLISMVQMCGVLILASGIPQVTQGGFATAVVGYVVMRAGLIGLWLRAAYSDPKRRRTCLRYVLAIVVLQALWVGRLWLPQEWGMPAFYLLVVLELLAPKWTERAGGTPWHPHHIAERYGLFTIIVLGECVLGASNAISAVLSTSGWSLDVALVGFGSVSLVMSLWWVYFLVPSGQALHSHRERVFGWAYPHFLVFGSVAALGAFLEVVADQLKGPADAGHAALTPTAIISLVVGAVTLYLLVLGWINGRVTRHAARLWWAYIPCILPMLAVIAAVSQGLRLPLALPLLTLGPLVLILLIEREIGRNPESFRIQ